MWKSLEIKLKFHSNEISNRNFHFVKIMKNHSQIFYPPFGLICLGHKNWIFSFSHSFLPFLDQPKITQLESLLNCITVYGDTSVCSYVDIYVLTYTAEENLWF
jgi:hypothetical protein